MKFIAPFLFFLWVLSAAEDLHDSKKAFFRIHSQEEYILVDAEFPWTIRNALFSYLPKLKKDASPSNIQKAMFQYVSEHFLLTKSDGQFLPLEKIKTTQEHGHNHQYNVVFYFKGTEFVSLKNTLMFNLNEKQKNYHVFHLNNKKVDFMTSKAKPDFFIYSKKTPDIIEKIGVDVF